MIAKLTGVIDSVQTGSLILDVNGVGYLIFASAKTLSQLGDKGSNASLLIETHVREDHIHLYGFASVEEKEWFSLLCTVQGVGAKVCLAILSVATPQELIMGIASGDKALVTSADGVGPKLGTRILTELKDKAGKMAFTTPVTTGGDNGDVVPSVANSANMDAVSALVNLGYNQSDAFKAVNEVCASNDDIDLSAIIRLSLKQLGGS